MNFVAKQHYYQYKTFFGEEILKYSPYRPTSFQVVVVTARHAVVVVTIDCVTTTLTLLVMMMMRRMIQKVASNQFKIIYVVVLDDWTSELGKAETWAPKIE